MIEYASPLHEKLAKGKFVVCSEMGPPIGANVDFIKKKTKMLKGLVDACNVTDNQTAIVRMSSIAASMIAQQEGLEMIIQVTCRDRNRIGLQSDILGASALGLRNVLCLTGDHQCFGMDRGSKNVFDLDSVQLIRVCHDMANNGVLLNGKEMKVPPVLFIGAAANPFGDPFEMQMIKVEKKIEAGAQFIQTQAIYNVERFVYWMEEMRKRGLDKKVYVMAGILPAKSVKALKMMKESVAGMDVPDWIISRMEQTADPQQEGVDIAVELINQVKDIEGVRGVHLMPVGWEKITPVIIEKAGLSSQSEVE